MHSAPMVGTMLSACDTAARKPACYSCDNRFGNYCFRASL